MQSLQSCKCVTELLQLFHKLSGSLPEFLR